MKLIVQFNKITPPANCSLYSRSYGQREDRAKTDDKRLNAKVIPPRHQLLTKCGVLVNVGEIVTEE